LLVRHCDKDWIINYLLDTKFAGKFAINYKERVNHSKTETVSISKRFEVVLMIKLSVDKAKTVTWNNCDSFNQGFDKEIRISRISVSVYQIINWIKKGELKLDKDKRLYNKWSFSKKSYYIESILIKFPSSCIYLCEERDGSRTIIDGYNRICALIEFVDNEFKLNSLNSMKNLNNRCFEDLEYSIQRRFLDSTLDLCIINSDCSPSSRYDIYKRVNSYSPKMMQIYIYSASKPALRSALTSMEEVWVTRLSSYINTKHSIYYKMRYQELSVIWLSCVLAYWKNKVPDEAFTIECMDSLNYLSNFKLEDMFEDFEHSINLTRKFFNDFHTGLIFDRNNVFKIFLLWSVIFQIWDVTDQHFDALIGVFNQVMDSDDKAEKILLSGKLEAEKLFYVIKKISDLLELKQR